MSSMARLPYRCCMDCSCVLLSAKCSPHHATFMLYFYIYFFHITESNSNMTIPRYLLCDYVCYVQSLSCNNVKYSCYFFISHVTSLNLTVTWRSHYLVTARFPWRSSTGGRCVVSSATCSRLQSTCWRWRSNSTRWQSPRQQSSCL